MNSEYNEVINNFEILKLFKMKDVLIEIMNQCKTDNIELLQIIKKLTEEEIKQRDRKAKEMNIKLGHFPYRKTIHMFDFDFQPGIDRNKIMDLMTLRFIDKAENVVFVGLPGTGKTMLSCCLGIEAASKRISTYFVSCSVLLNDLKKAKYENKLDARLKQYCKYKLLILDEFGFLPLNKDDANLLFQLISRRYESKSIIITTNVPFSKWGESLNDSVIANAILDRLLHHSHVIQIDGPSYRTKDIMKEVTDGI
ncbi:TPA: IS21-like element helper ATPase IstB [Clostridioides difficile]|nr:IS21-like element helper ATPase IstB [Clostridioides difficile]HBG7272513.1 IS21-like element helper ATPase IstB [Clostridioides difficile]HBG7276176.1 IS21-like element helper ATPase IstB [Clostridioides difficile]